jgi:diacylglycerol kinase
MNADHDIKVINSLIETVIDSADGYTEAAKEAAKDQRSSPYCEIFRRRG